MRQLNWLRPWQRFKNPYESYISISYLVLLCFFAFSLLYIIILFKLGFSVFAQVDFQNSYFLLKSVNMYRYLKMEMQNEVHVVLSRENEEKRRSYFLPWDTLS